MLEFYKNKKVLITGHNGFKGSWLTLILKHLGAKIIGVSLKLDKNHSKKNLINIFKLKNEIREYFIDINNFTKLKQTIIKEQPDIIFHLAAQSLVYEAVKYPLKNYHTNIIGLINVLESLKYTKKTKFVSIITSDKCYINDEKKNLKESDQLGGDDPYSASKACAEIISKSYYKTYFDKNLNIYTFRGGNVIGGGDFLSTRLVPDLINFVYDNQKLILRNTNSSRPWQNVLDVLFSYLLYSEILYKKNIRFENMNIGPDKSYKVEKILKYFTNHYDLKIKYGIDFNKKDIEKKYLKLNCEKSKKYFNFRRMSFDKSLKKTFNWYDSFYLKENMRIFSNNEIIEYINNYIKN
jgi:CDP-glucose 4,6-dehydratase